MKCTLACHELVLHGELSGMGRTKEGLQSQLLLVEDSQVSQQLPEMPVGTGVEGSAAAEF